MANRMIREITQDAELRRDMAALLRHALEKNHKLDPCQCSPCEKIAELAGAEIIERACGQDETGGEYKFSAYCGDIRRNEMQQDYHRPDASKGARFPDDGGKNDNDSNRY